MNKTILIFAYTLVCSSFIVPKKTTEKTLRYENYIYEDAIQTVQLVVEDTQDPVPVISLNGNERLKLSFDELKPKSNFYQYTYVHCDAYWNPTNLQPNEFIKGMMFENVNDFKFSSNTFKRYVHYSTSLPTVEMRPFISGNYILKVYRNYDENDLIITRKFMVLDNRVSIKGTVKPATASKFRYTRQEIDFNIDYKGYTIPNPYNDAKVIISQNNRWDNVIFGLRPRFINDNLMNFDYEEENVMNGGNEFRFFDTRTLRNFSQNVQKKFFDSLNKITHTILYNDKSKQPNQYVQFIDFNGKRVIANKDGQNSEIDGDYTWVYFTLDANNFIKEGDVYVFGELTDWRIQNKFKMSYDPIKKIYECMVLLKQGYYNYEYVVAPEGSARNFDETLIEGNHFETENDYVIYFYHKNQFYEYDELVGLAKLNSRVNNK